MYFQNSKSEMTDKTLEKKKQKRLLIRKAVFVNYITISEGVMYSYISNI